MPAPGEILGKYYLEDVLGRGGMSVVFRARDQRLARLVALKVMAEALANDEDYRRRFRREARLAASIDHPNVIPVYEAGKVGPVLYLAMRLVEGYDLGQLIEEERFLTVERTVELLAQVARGLDAAHRRSLIHRDIKASNVLIASEGGAGASSHVYLSDFGLTKRTTTQSGPTQSGQIVGTPSYLAPEQIEGRELTPKVDIYALGCLAFECLVGAPPFENASQIEVLYAHVHRVPPRVSERRPDLPPSIDTVVARALSKSPTDRYATATAFVEALERARTARPEAARRTVSLPGFRAPLPASGTGVTAGRGRRRATGLLIIFALAAVILGLALLRPDDGASDRAAVRWTVASPSIIGPHDEIRETLADGVRVWLSRAVGVAAAPRHTASWQAELPMAAYRIEAFIPADAGGASVAYSVGKVGDKGVAVPVDQRTVRGGWAPLGTHVGKGSDLAVVATDANDSVGEEIAWSTVRWKRIGPVPSVRPIVLDDPRSLGPGPAPDRLVDGGHQGDLWRARGAEEAGPQTTYVEWVAAGLPVGTYRIDVYLPGAHTAASARYVVGPGAREVTVVQGRFGEQWVTLGMFEVIEGSAAPFVRSSTTTGDVGQEIAWDAVRWTPVAV